MGKKIKVFYDSEMDTLDIWFEEPPEEGFSRELDDGIIVKYDRDERVVGLEILFLSKQKLLGKTIPAELRGELGRTLNEFVDSLKKLFF
jgi:uncharacterized protein YuzE